MDFVRAFTYVFDDPDWVSKLVPLAAVSVFAVLFTPLLIGLAGWAVLIGWQLDLIRNVRAEVRHPLPVFEDLSRYFTNGLVTLTAFIVYNIPTFLLLACTSWMLFNLDQTLTGTMFILSISCLLFPALLAYNLLIWPILTLGMGRFTDEPRSGVYYEFGDLFALLRSNLDIFLQWAVAVVLTNLIFSILFSIPCVGWLIGIVLLVPVQGHLAGQFNARLFGKPKKRTPPPVVPRRV